MISFIDTYLWCERQSPVGLNRTDTNVRTGKRFEDLLHTDTSRVLVSFYTFTPNEVSRINRFEYFSSRIWCISALETLGHKERLVLTAKITTIEKITTSTATRTIPAVATRRR